LEFVGHGTEVRGDVVGARGIVEADVAAQNFGRALEQLAVEVVNKVLGVLGCWVVAVERVE